MCDIIYSGLLNMLKPLHTQGGGCPISRAAGRPFSTGIVLQHDG